MSEPTVAQPVMNGRVDTIVRWMRALSRFQIADGEFRVVLAVSLTPIGGRREITQAEGTVVAIEFPWIRGAVRTYFRVDDGTHVAFVSPVPRDSSNFKAALEAGGFVVETKSTPKLMRPIAPLVAPALVWPLARHYGWLSHHGEAESAN